MSQCLDVAQLRLSDHTLDYPGVGGVRWRRGDAASDITDVLSRNDLVLVQPEKIKVSHESKKRGRLSSLAC